MSSSCVRWSLRPFRRRGFIVKLISKCGINVRFWPTRAPSVNVSLICSVALRRPGQLLPAADSRYTNWTNISMCAKYLLTNSINFTFPPAASGHLNGRFSSLKIDPVCVCVCVEHTVVDSVFVFRPLTVGPEPVNNRFHVAADPDLWFLRPEPWNKGQTKRLIFTLH